MATCIKCGNEIEQYFGAEFNTRLLKEQYDHSCDFWARFKEDMDEYPDRNFVIEGNGYSVQPDRQTSAGSLGFGGAEFVIQPHGKPLFVTHNLWHRGDVPEAWKEDLPDNAVFVVNHG